MKENEIREIMDESGFISWYNYAPQDELLVIRSIKMEIKLKSATGIILAAQETKETIAPDAGVVVSQGSDVKGDWIGKVVYYAPQVNFPLQMIRPDEDGSTYSMVPETRIDAILVKDVRL